MRDNIELSIIVPVYNVEKYIKKCLETILNQMNSKVELIIVNDCSPDNSIDVCYHMIENYSNAKIIQREKNGGLSATRNTGLCEARGKYVWFVDSDDYVEKNSIKRLLECIKLNQADIIQFNHYRFGDEAYQSSVKQGHIIIDSSEKRLQYICGYLSNAKDGGYEVWRRIYSLDMIREHHILFQPNKEIFAEDICFNLEYFRYCNSVEVIEDSLYYYRVRKSSIMGSLESAKLHEMQLLAWRDYITLSDRNIKKRYDYIYAGIMQVRYNGVHINKLIEYCKSLNEKEFVIEMNNSIKKNAIKHIRYYGKKASLLHFLYAQLILSIINKKRIRVKVIDQIRNRIKM